MLLEQQTGWAELRNSSSVTVIYQFRALNSTNQELPPMPMTEMGLQVTPTTPVRLPTTTPSKPSKAVTGLLKSVASWTLLQHWIGPVLHSLAGVVGVPVRRTAVAAAKPARARVVRAEILICMLREEYLNGCCRLFE